MDFGASSNVNAACGLIDDKYFRLSSEPFGDDDFLLVATGKIAGQLPDGRCLDSQAGDVFFRQSVFCSKIEEGALGALPSPGKSDILADCHCGEQSLSLPVFGNVSDAELDRLFRTPDVDLLAI
jgi:hypothetical protein